MELVRILQQYNIPAEPGQAVSFGSTPDVVGVPGIHPEVKRVERLNVRDASRFGDGMPTLFHRRNRSPWLVTMQLEDWLELYQSERR